MRIIFFGTPDFAVPSLKALLAEGEEVVLAVTQPDKVKGRGHRIAQPPVKEFAAAHGIPVIQPPGIRLASFPEELNSYRPDVIVVVAYGRIIPPEVLGLPPLGCINVHGSLLPKYRGAGPIQWALINGERKTGITTMRMDEGLDTGDILMTEETHIGDDDDAVTLGERLAVIGAGLLVKTLKGLKDGSLHARPQEGEASYAPPLTREDGRISWSGSAAHIRNLIRGTYPWPGAVCLLNGERLMIIRASVPAPGGRGEPGKITRISAEGIEVGTGEGLLLVKEVKPEGKKAMPASAFANGRRLKEGMSFGSA